MGQSVDGEYDPFWVVQYPQRLEWQNLVRNAGNVLGKRVPWCISIGKGCGGNLHKGVRRVLGCGNQGADPVSQRH